MRGPSAMGPWAREASSEEAVSRGGEPQQPEVKKQTRWWVELLVVVVGRGPHRIPLADVRRRHVLHPVRVDGADAQIGDRIVVDKLSYHLHGVGTGDIVVFSTPANEDCAGPPVSDLVKRVIGLPGQTVSLSEGRVYIDGVPLPEPWLPLAVRTETYPGPSLPPIRFTMPTECRAATCTSWATTGRNLATADIGARSANRPSSARSTCESGRSPGSAFF